MSPRKTHHVVPNRKGDWDSKKGGGAKSIKHFDRKDDAKAFTRKISQNQKGELLIHGRDGKIQKSDSHGGNPCPSKDNN
jgi:hypothetical protein